MPQTWTAPELFFEHRGIKVFHTYKNGEYISDYHFTLDESDDDLDCDNGFQFDVRDLKAVGTTDVEVIRAAIEAGEFLKGMFAECPFCNRDNSADSNICDAEDCPGVMAQGTDPLSPAVIEARAGLIPDETPEATPDGVELSCADYNKLIAFVRQAAALTKDQECVECGSREEENPDCDDHELWDMPNDDAVETLHDLISGARELLTNEKGER